MKPRFVPEFIDRFAWTRWAWYRRWCMRRAQVSALRASEVAIEQSWKKAHVNWMAAQLAKNERFLRDVGLRKEASDDASKEA
jgi:hypothetical protein